MRLLPAALASACLLAALPLALASSAAAPTGPGELGFWCGHWELETDDWTPNGRVTGRATSDVAPILDGHALLDDFRALSPAGEVLFRGTSVRTHDAASGMYLIRWIMVGDPGMTDIRARWNDGVLEGEGRGSDRGGAFQERFVYEFDEARDAYEFRMDRSYDGGEQWLEDFSVIRARRVSDDGKDVEER